MQKEDAQLEMPVNMTELDRRLYQRRLQKKEKDVTQLPMQNPRTRIVSRKTNGDVVVW